MKHLNSLNLLIIALACIQTACNKVTDTTPIPTTYSFENVNYSNQVKRIDMLNELAAYAKTANAVSAPALDKQKLLNMYQNTNSPFHLSELNSATAQLKNKVHSSMQAEFESYIDALATISSNTNQIASNGQAGIASSNNSVAHYLLNANGLELAQVIEKGIAGACFYNQASEIYFGNAKMAVDNKVVTDGKGTTMEHHWDEAFGYFGAPTDFPSNTANLNIWAKYSNKVNASLSCNQIIMNGFLKGRAAISSNDLTTRDLAISEIRHEWERVIAAVAISYMNDAKANASDAALWHHNLTEVYAFLMALKYGGTPSISNNDIDLLLIDLAGSNDVMTANLYDTTITNIDNTINRIVQHFPSLDAYKNAL